MITLQQIKNIAYDVKLDRASDFYNNYELCDGDDYIIGVRDGLNMLIRHLEKGSIGQEIRTCSVCNKKDKYENMIMDIREILECSEQRINEWYVDNTDIDLLDWFCMSCCKKVVNKIEEEV